MGLRAFFSRRVYLALCITFSFSVSAEPLQYEVERVFQSLTFTNAVFLTHAPGESGKLYVVEQRGQIHRFDQNAAQPQKELFLDIGDRISSSGGEQGLLGLAFEPASFETKRFYVAYTASDPLRVVFSRFKRSEETGLGDPDSEEVLIAINKPGNPPFGNHNGGMIAFGPDGMLYIGTGDGGSGGDPFGLGQDISSLMGAMLRIDVNTETDYRVPRDNPFTQTPNARSEIWATGLRNPWKFSFDRVGGALFVGDVGQNAFEEINKVEKGKNYGWNPCEGFFVFRSPTRACPDRFAPPVHAYSHRLGRSVTGGYVYRGSRLPSLEGQYLFTDYLSRKIWAFPADSVRVEQATELTSSTQNISSFGEDENGEVFLVGHSSRGGIFQLKLSE